MMLFKIFPILFLPIFLFGIVLEEEVENDLRLIGLPYFPTDFSPEDILDVAIIGGGQAGLALCLDLYRHGVFAVQIFDKASLGKEGPWQSVARMTTLRTHKYAPGPSLDIPHLTFHAWYEARGGNWKDLDKIPTGLWGDYLQWYAQVLKLPLVNDSELLSINPVDGLLRLEFKNHYPVQARKVVLATGFDGCGGFETPSFLANLPKCCWFHTGEEMDPVIFKGKRLCVIGAGASAFDIAASALESGAKKVELVMRRKELPEKNFFAEFDYWPAFYRWSDLNKIQFFERGYEIGVPPPEESVARAKVFPEFHFYKSTSIKKISYSNEIVIETSNGKLFADYLIVGTGYAVDVTRVKELSMVSSSILLWGDMKKNMPQSLGKYPYLGPHFQFLEKNVGEAPHLKNIHCFNAGALLSHGFIVVNIDALPDATHRLADGIASDLFLFSLPQ